MDRKIYHVKYRKSLSKWEARRMDAFRAAILAPTKDEVVREITDRVKNIHAQVVIHDQNGRIEEERTFPRGSDPKRRAG